MKTFAKIFAFIAMWFCLAQATLAQSEGGVTPPTNPTAVLGSAPVSMAVPLGVLPTSPMDPFEVRLQSRRGDETMIAKRKALAQSLLAKDRMKVTSFIVSINTGQRIDVTYYAHPKEGRFDFFFEAGTNTLCQRGGVAAQYYLHEDGWLIVEMSYKEKPESWNCDYYKLVFDPLDNEGRVWVAPHRATTAGEYKMGRNLKLIPE